MNARPLFLRPRAGDLHLYRAPRDLSQIDARPLVRPTLWLALALALGLALVNLPAGLQFAFYGLLGVSAALIVVGASVLAWALL